MGMTYRVVGIRHCVKGANSHGELVQDEEVSAVLKVKIDIFFKNSTITYKGIAIGMLTHTIQ